jgi:large subunit GTPase 1
VSERKNIKIITTDSSTTNPYLLTPAQESQLLKKHSQKKSALTVPRRPAWTTDTTPSALDLAERESFLEWRRGLAHLQESDDLLLTPFERNIEVWRQLWRVIERSDLVVQIVDARNPLFFRTEDLEKYVLEVDPEKRNLLLVNKADLMTLEQRRGWADWFEEQGIRFAFYSARLAKEAQETQEEVEDDKESDEEEREEQEQEDEDADEESGDEEEHIEDDLAERLAEEVDELSIDSELDDDEAVSPASASHPTSPPSYTILDPAKEDTDPRTQILTVNELQSLFLRESPPPKGHDPAHPQKIIVGLVGYPNVGKSSTINSLLGEKKVSVSSTPGKTKHFQTIHLSSLNSSAGVILCDCPGLVFPNFASTKAELVCNGVLPIDQLREWTGPGGLIARRIPKEVLEQVYSFKVYTKSDTEEGHGKGVTGEELLISFARILFYE